MYRTLISLCVVVLVVLTTAALVLAATPAVVDTVSLNLRNGPGTGYQVIDTLRRNDQLVVVSNQGDWRQVRTLLGQIGWVFGQYLSTDPTLLVEDRVLQVRVARLNLRQGPDLKYPVIGFVQEGQLLNSSGRIGGWYRVTVSGLVGFVHYDYVDVIDENNPPQVPVGVPLAQTTVNALNMRTGPGVQFPVITRLERNTMVVVLEDGAWSRIMLDNGATGFVASEYITATEGQAVVRINASAVNQRTGPGTDFSVMATHALGSTLTYLGFESGWIKVSSNAGEGYILSSLLSIGFASDSGSLAGPLPDLNGFRVVVDPGHGGRDPGAIGVNGLYEKNVNLTLARKLVGLLTQAGAQVIMTRDSDITVTLDDRVAIANGSRADLVVSIHNNAHPNANVSGTQVFYGVTAGSFALGNEVHRQLLGLGISNMGLRSQSFRILSKTNIPAILTETLFLSNRSDAALLAQDSFLDQAAVAQFRGISQWLLSRR
ncbi:MAG TPA: N-acetylmuramoyl-L-alanine amidase [Bacillota bacterium]|nr:N-acetylmuramoyl-L-alanine amidase [Bacillota bacterium]